jgi:putative colanic acid biosynthesis acetyltransferase WcaF
MNARPETDAARPEEPSRRQTAGLEAADHVQRSRSPYSLGIKIKRVLWMLFGQPLMRLTFHNWYGARRGLLRLFGARIAPSARVRPSVRVEQPWNLTIGEDTMVGDHVILYCLGKVVVGARCSISQYAHLCAGTHDYTRPDMPLLTLPVTLEDEVWVAADAFIGPGVTLHEGVVIGARSSVHRDCDAWSVYAGNPAKRIKERVLRDADGAVAERRDG